MPLKISPFPIILKLSKSISDALEEKEREEFTRLKVIKRNKGRGKCEGRGDNMRGFWDGLVWDSGKEVLCIHLRT